MTRASIKDHILTRLKYDPKKGRQEILDPPEWGHGTFGVRVNKTCISFIFLYSFHGKPRRLTLGNYPDLSLANARSKAKQAAELLEQGLDPGQKKVMELFEYRESPSVAEAVKTYLEWAERNKTSWKEDQRMLERELVEPLGRMKLQDVKRKQIISLLDEKAKTAPVAANRIQAVIRKLFNFCVERELISATPLVQMKRVAKEIPRERALNRHELVWLFHRLAEPTLTIDTRFALLLSLLLAQRSGRIVAMRWVDLDLEEAIWDRSGKFEKNNNPIAIPLPQGVVEILEFLRQRRVEKLEKNHPDAESATQRNIKYGNWVFPGRGTGTHLLQPTLNRAMRRWYDGYIESGVAEEEGLLRIAEGYPRPTVHDLRRTATTHMSGRGLGKDVRGRLLNHKDLSVDAIYDRYAYFDEKATALVDWFDYLMGLFRKEFGSVSWVEFYGKQVDPLEQI